MLEFTPDKRGEILKAAFEVFAAYGFRKTSMDDIARQASMSRPALYQEFKNKTDIFRGLSAGLLDHAVRAATRALQSDRPFTERFLMAVDVSMLEVHRALLSSPHGQELTGINDEIAADIDQLWRERLTDTFSAGIEAAMQKGEFESGGFTAYQIARMFMSAMEGLRQEFSCNANIEGEAQLLVRFFTRNCTVSAPHEFAFAQ